MSIRIDPDYSVDEINRTIDQYVRIEHHREMLRDHLFRGMTYAQIAEKYGYEEKTVGRLMSAAKKNVIKHL